MILTENTSDSKWATVRFCVPQSHTGRLVGYYRRKQTLNYLYIKNISNTMHEYLIITKKEKAQCGDMLNPILGVRDIYVQKQI